MKNYHCPNFLENRDVFESILMLQKDYPDVFIKDASIASAFGIFPNMIWNGGGFFCGPQYDFGAVKETYDFYRFYSIPIKLTLTNPVLDEIDCLDKYCNAILTISSDYSDIVEALVSSPILENHIRTFFPDIVLNHSIIATKEDKNVNAYIDECQKYKNIVLPRRLVKNESFLKSIPVELRNRFEILCTDPCPIDCPRLYQHYRDYGEYQRGNKIETANLGCTNFCSPFKYAEFKEYQIDVLEIETFYEPLQYSEFKISGRNGNMGILNMVPMFFKPEYHKDAYSLFL